MPEKAAQHEEAIFGFQPLDRCFQAVQVHEANQDDKEHPDLMDLLADPVTKVSIF